ncbi:hypothetical protein IV203_007156 [Nitzschia inconspicua]|uniref:Uncharacterized protein n=1 Tax=Nitzschia inconspicua TaxID=303405 RepID=A0A9K3KE62_9STRA|nr:hypothetical protein IV203_007156 [Nitzschia inconspicua]
MYLAYKYFVWKTAVPFSFLRFRRKLAKALIYNEHIAPEEEDTMPRKSKRKQERHDHTRETAQKHVRMYDGRKWIWKPKTPIKSTLAENQAVAVFYERILNALQVLGCARNTSCNIELTFKWKQMRTNPFGYRIVVGSLSKKPSPTVVDSFCYQPNSVYLYDSTSA